MGVTCLLLDRKKRYHSLLADIFSITGHKLLIALDEAKAFELLRVLPPEVIIMSSEDMDFWFKLLDSEIYIPPFFFVESYEEGDSLKVYGLRELNYMVLPFNPIELLTKVVELSKDSLASSTNLGPMNILLKLLRSKSSSLLKLVTEEGQCTLCIKEGVVEGSECSMDRIRRAFKEATEVETYPYDHSKVNIKHLFKNNWGFISGLLKEELLTEEQVSTAAEEVPTKPALDLTQPIELGDKFYWLGVGDEEGLFQRNSYLRIYERENVKVPILINPGSHEDYPTIRAKLEQIIGTVDALRAAIVLGSNLDECYNALSLLQVNQRLVVITSLGIALKLRTLGIPMGRIKTIESLPNRKLKLATGDVLEFKPANFLPESGSFVMLEENKGRLFSGRLFSSLCLYEEFSPMETANPEDLLLYSLQVIPSRKLAQRAADLLKEGYVEAIFPAIGKPVLGSENVLSLSDKLYRLRTVEESVEFEDEHILEVCQGLLESIKSKATPGELNPFLEELNQYAYIHEGNILESMVSVQNLPNLIIGLMVTKGVRPKLIREAVRYLYMSGLFPITI
ncbi:MAG: hypothetical protein D6674_07310 [Acidobacteria bacterium]|jgi:hypothetical protein|nr:MAG: hypothetical protein D6674_07310 [Acidobacteriota bacterium]